MGGWLSRGPRVWAGIAVGTVAACAAVLSLGGCGSSATRVPSGRQIAVTERDFHIALNSTYVAAGRIVLRVHNGGPDQHELIVVPEGRAAPPIRSDGFT